MQEKSIEQIIATELKVTKHQIWAAVKLLDNGATVPFIARYRKEATGGLSDTHLRMLADRLDYLRELERERISILQTIGDQGKLTDSLKLAIENAQTKAALEDLYLPFRPKKGSKAQNARAMGLEPLAEKLLSHPRLAPEIVAQEFINPDKGVSDILSALAGAREILIEKFSEEAQLIGRFRETFWNNGWIVSKAAKSLAELGEDGLKFTDYFEFREPLKKIPSHRVLAILRGRHENILRISFATDGFADFDSAIKEKDLDYIVAVCEYFKITPLASINPWLLDTVKAAWRYKIRLRLEVDILTRLKKEADEEAIKVFAQNLKNLLLAAPAGPRVTMGLDPGYRTGVKVAVVNKTGHVLETSTIYPHAPQEEWLAALKNLSGLAKKHSVELIAIGNGTASRETDDLVQTLIKQNPDLKLEKLVVSEAGASVYSASELASSELPNLDVSIRGAVSIARRLQDPLAELVKIDPKAIGVGQYQHDVSQMRLGKMLENVVQDCVNTVGVDLNTASASLLSYISGLNKKITENIIQERNTKGAFKNRLQLLNIPGFGPKVFEQAAGFLKILDGDNPLDASAVHPESYEVVEKILSQNSKQLHEIIGNTTFLKSLQAEQYADEKFGVTTTQDILNELEKPGRDPRPEFKTATFKDTIKAIDDLKNGMILEGIITNVANFGAFVDIGVHQDGLVHISELADQFIRDPHEVAKTGQVVKVKVLEIDKTRKRIALSMRGLGRHKI